MGEVFRVGIGDDASCLVSQRELSVTKEVVVGGSNEPTCHLQDGVGGPSLDACGQFLGFGFERRFKRFGHDDLLPG